MTRLGRAAVRVAVATLATSLMLPLAAPPVAAVAVLGSVPIDCPILTPNDIAVLGSDTIVVGWGLDEGDPVGDVLVCRIKPNGDATWTRTISNAYRLASISVAVGASSIYVATNKQTEPDLVEYGFVRRYAFDGAVQQSIDIGAGSETVAHDVAVSPNGRVYVTGESNGELGDDPPPPRTPTMADAFVRAFEADLDVLWTDQFRGITSHEFDSTPRQGFAWGTAIAAEDAGVYATGLVVGTLPGGPATRHGEDTFVRKYGTDGSVKWTRQFDATFPEAESDFYSEAQTHPGDIALSSQGVHVVGVSQLLTDRDLEHGYDAFQRLYGRDGTVRWTKEIGGFGVEGARKVLPDATGSLLFGVAPEGLDEDDGPATYFLARYGPTGTLENTFEFAPTGWYTRGSAITGDGVTLRLAAVVEEEPGDGDPSPDVIPPPGTNLVRFDATPPAVGVPAVLPVPGIAMTAGSMPLDITWTASDGGSSVSGSDVEVSRSGGPWTHVTVAAVSSRVARTAGPTGGTIRARVRATDGAGNTAAWIYGPTLNLAVVQETSSSIKESAAWQRVAQSGALGGSVDKTGSAGATARYTFSGRSIAWIGGVGPARGRADVYVDGKFVIRIDSFASAFAARRVLFARTWASSGTHTIELRNRGTDGRPRIDLDAFIVLK